MSSDPSASAQPGESSSNALLPTTEVKEEELDTSISAAITTQPTDTQPDAMNLDGANDMDGNAPSGPPAADGIMGAGAPPTSELRIPTKKDASLREFLSKMDDYAPIVRATHPTPPSQHSAQRLRRFSRAAAARRRSHQHHPSL